MIIKKLNLPILILIAMTLFLFSCGKANEEVESKSFGLQINKVTGDNQILEDPSEIADQELTIKATNTDGGPLTNTKIAFEIVNPESGAELLDENSVTNSEGMAKVKIKGGNDFGVIAKVKAAIQGTAVETVFTVSIRNKIIPEKIIIVKPNDIVAGQTGSIQLRLTDRNGRLSFEPEFQTSILVNFNAPSGNHTNAVKFSPTDSSSRKVTFVGGLATLTNVWAHKAEDIAIGVATTPELTALEASIERTVDITNTETLTIVPDVPVKALIVDPTDATTDDQIPVSINLVDQYENPATNYPGPCNIDLVLAGVSPEVVNTLNSDPKIGTMTIVSGSGQLLIKDSLVETVSLSMQNPLNCGGVSSSSPVTFSSTQDVNFLVGAVAAVDMSTPLPSTLTVDDFSTVGLRMTDAGGNTVTTFNGSVKLKLTGSGYIPVSEGILNETINFTSGLASIKVRNKEVETINVSVEDFFGLGIDVTDNHDINFLVGAAKQFAFASTTHNGDADNGVAVTVEIWDQYGNHLPSWTGGSVNIAADGNATSPTVVNFAPGESTKTVTITDRTAESINLSFSDLGSSLLETNDGSIETARARFLAGANIRWGIIKKIEIEDPTDGTIDSPISVSVIAKDNWGNTVKDYTTTDVELIGDGSSSNSGVVSILSNGTGARSIQDLVSETVNLSLALKSGVTDLKNSLNEDIDISSTQDVYFKWGIATSFTLPDPADGTVDSSINVIAQVRDQGGNIVEDYTGSVSIRADGNANHDSYLSGVQTKSITFNGTTGVISTDIFDQVAEVVNISIIDSAGTGYLIPASQSVTFSPGTVRELSFENPPAATVDDPVNLRIKTLDQFGNHNTTYNSDDLSSINWITQGSAQAYPTSSDETMDFNGGVSQIQLSNTIAETVRVGFTPPTDNGITNFSQQVDIIFAPGVVTQIVTLPPAASTITTDNDATIILQAQDQYGNINNNYEEDIVFLVNASAVLPTSASNPKEKLIDITSGIASIDVRDFVAEDVTLSLRDDIIPNRGLTLDDVDITFLPGVAAKYTIMSAPPSNADTPATITVQCLDSHDNRVFTHTDDVRIKIQSGTAFLSNPAPAFNYIPDGVAGQSEIIDLNSGQGIIYLTDRIAEDVEVYLESIGGQTLTLSHESGGPYQVVSFIHGSPTEFKFKPLATLATTDTPFQIDVIARDNWGNTATTYNSDIAVTVNKNAFISGTSNDKTSKITITNGEGSVLVEDLVSENFVQASLGNQLGSNADSLDITDTLIFNVSFGAPDYFAIIDPTNDATTDAAFPVNVEVRDQNHNIITSGFSGRVNFKVSGNAFIGTLGTQTIEVNFGTNGVGVETVLVSNQSAEVVGLSLGDPIILGELQNVTDKKFPLEVKDLRFKAGTVSQFELIADSCVNVDNDCKTDIEAQDQYGNKNLEFNDANAIKLEFNAGAQAYFVGSANASFSTGSSSIDIGNNKAEMVTANMANLSGAYNFVNTRDITFIHGAATKYEFKSIAIAPTTDTPVLVEVQALDQHDNLVLNYANSVQLKVNSGGGGVTGGYPPGALTSSPWIISNFTGGIGNISIDKTQVGVVQLGLQANGDPLDTSDTIDINFAHGVVAYYRFVDPTPPAQRSVDDTYIMRVEAVDADFNLATSFGGGGAATQVTLNYATNGATAGGAGTYEFNSGYFEATLTNQTTETITYALNTPSPNTVDATDTVDLTWTAGAATQLVVMPQGGANFTVDDTVLTRVEARDQYNNFSSLFTGTADLTVNKNAYIDQGDTPETTTVKTIQLDFSTTPGYATAPVEDLTQESNVQLSTSNASAAGIVTYTPATINFDNGVAVIYSLSSVDGTVDATVEIQLEAHDRGGNIVDNMADHPVTLKSSGSAYFAPANAVINLISGIGSIDIGNQVAETVTVEIDSLGNPPQTSILNVEVDIKFDPGIVTQLSVQSPSIAVAGAPINSVILEAQDQFGNRNDIDGNSYQVDLIAEKDIAGDNRSNSTETITNGQLVLTPTLTIAEDVKFRLQNPNPNINSSSNPIDVTSTSVTTIDPNAPTKLVFSPISNDTVDNSIFVEVQVHDNYGNVVTTASDQVADFNLISASGQVFWKAAQANLTSGRFTIQNGTQTYELKNTVAEDVTIQMVQPNDSPTNETALALDADKTVTFSPGAPVKYKIIPPASATVVDTLSFDILVQDQFNNTVTSAGTAGSPGRVKLNATIPGGSVDITQGGVTTATSFDLEVISGIANVDINTTKAATAQIQLTNSTVTDPLSLSPDPTVFDIIFGAGPTTKITMLDPIDTTVDSTGVDVTLQAFDIYNNPTTDFSGESIKISSDLSGKFNATSNQAFKTVVFSNGVASAQVIDQVAETVTLSLSEVNTYFTDNSIDITSTQDLVFEPGEVKFIGIDTASLPSSPTVDNDVTVNFKAYDQYLNHNTLPVTGSIATAFKAELNSPSPSTKGYIGTSGTIAKDIDIANGVASIDIHNEGAEAVVLTMTTPASGLGFTGTNPLTITFGHGAVKFLTIEDPDPLLDKTVDDTVTVSIHARDQYGNIGTTFGGESVKLNATATTGTPTVQSAGKADFVTGVAQLTVNSTINETVNLSLTDNYSLPTGISVNSSIGSNNSTESILFGFGAHRFYKFVETNITNVTIDDTITINVQATDQYQNIISNFADTDRLTITHDGDSTVNDTTLTFSAGLSSFTVNNLTPETVTLGMIINATDTTAGITALNSSQITFDVGAPHHYAVVTPLPTNLTVDNGTTLTLHTLDQGNNHVTTAAGGQVVLNASNAAGDVFIDQGAAPVTDSIIVTIGSNGVGIVNLRTEKVGNVSVTLAKHNTDLPGDGITHNLNFEHGVVTRLAFNGVIMPSTESVDNQITATVRALDQYNNIVSSFGTDTASDKATLESSGTGKVFPNGTDLIFANGIATQLYENHKDETITLSLSNAGNLLSTYTSLNISSSHNIIFTPGVVTKFAFSNPASPQSVDSSAAGINVTVQALDQYGNHQTDATAGSFSNELGISVSSSSNLSYLDSSSIKKIDTLDITNGSAGFTVHNPISELTTISMTSSASGKTLGVNEDILWQPGAVAFITMVNPIDVSVDDTAQIKIEARDQYCNKVSAAGATYKVNMISNSGSTTFATNPAVITAGQALIDMNETLVQTVTLTMTPNALPTGVANLTCNSPLGATYPHTQNIVFSPGAPKKIKFQELATIQGSLINVDATVPVLIEALDQHDNLVTMFGDTSSDDSRISVTSNSPSTSISGGNKVNFISGVGTIQVDETKSGESTFSLADSGTGINVSDTRNIIWDHGQAKKFAIEVPNNPLGVTIDNTQVITVNALDQYDNLHDNYAGNITVNTISTYPREDITNSLLQSGITKQLASGTADFTLKSISAETTSFKIINAANNAQGNAVLANQTKTFTFTPGNTAQMEILSASSGTVDNPITVEIKAWDAGLPNHNVNDNRPNIGIITISGTDSNTCTVNKTGQTSNVSQSSPFDMVAGIARVDIKCEQDATFTLTLSGLPTGETIRAGTESITFAPGVLNQVSFLPSTPSSITADDTASTFYLEAQDQFGNLVDYNGKVEVQVDPSSPDNTNVSIPGDKRVTFSSGLGSLANFTVTTAPQDIKFGLKSVPSFSIPDLSNTYTVSVVHGAPTTIAVKQPSAQTVGQPRSFKVQIFDQHGNLASSAANHNVDIAITGSSSNSSILLGNSSAGTPNTGSITKTITNGENTIALYSEKAQTVSLALSNSSPSLAHSSQKNFVYNPDVATTIGFDSPAVAITTDDTHEIKLTAKDQFGNTATTYSSSNIYLSSAGSNLVIPGSGGTSLNLGATPVIFSSGVAGFDIQNTFPETVAFGINVGGSGLLVETGANAHSVSVSVGAPHHFLLGLPSTGNSADQNGVANIDIIAQDQWNNNTSTSEQVTINTTGSATFTSTNSFIVNFSNQAISNITVTNRVAESVTLSLSSPGGGLVIEGSSRVMEFTHGVPTNIFFDTIPTNAATDFPAEVEIELKDNWGNLCTSTTDKNVTLDTTYLPIGGGIASSTTGHDDPVNFSGGSASFTIASTTAQTVRMSLSSSDVSLVIPNNQNLVFGWGTPAKIEYATLTGNTVNSTLTVVAQVRDSLGNWLQEHSGTVAFSQAGFTPLNNGQTGNAPSGFGSITSSNGQFSIGSITSQQAGTLTLNATQTTGNGNPTAGTGNASFTAGGATKLSLATPYTSFGIITVPMGIQMYALDQYSNTTTYAGSINCTLGADQFARIPVMSPNEAVDGYFAPTAGTSTKSISFSNGNATVNIRRETQGWTNLNCTGLTMINNNGAGEDYYFQPGDPVKYIFMEPSYLADGNFKAGDSCISTDDCHASTDGPVPVEVQAVDVSGTRSEQYEGSVEVYIKTDPNQATGYGVKRVNFTEGRATLTIGDTQAETLVIGVRDSEDENGNDNDGSMNTTEELNFKIGAGKVESIQMASIPSVNAGSSTTLQISARDSSNNIVPTYRGSFDLVGSSYVAGMGSFNLVDGVAEVTIGSNRAGTYPINIADTFSTGVDVSDQENFVVSPKDPNRIPTDCNESATTTDGRLRCWSYTLDQFSNGVSSWVGSVKIEVLGQDGNPLENGQIWSAETGGTKLWDQSTDGNTYCLSWGGSSYINYYYVKSISSEIVTVRVSQSGNQEYTDQSCSGSQASPAINSSSWSPSRYIAPAQPTEFKIKTPIASGSPGATGVDVTVEAFTVNGSLASAYEGYVYLRVANDPNTNSSSTISSGELVHIVNGTGTLTVTNSEPEIISVALEQVNSSYNGITHTPELGSGSENIVFSGGVASQLFVQDPGTGTTGLPLIGTVTLQDSNGFTATNATGSPILVDITSNNPNIVVSASPISIPNGASSATYTLTTTSSGSADITASNAVLTNNTRTVSFDIGAVTKIVHKASPYPSSSTGEILIEIEAQSAQSVVNSSYSQTFQVSHNGDSSTTAPVFVNVSGGTASFTVSSTKAQSVQLSITEFASSGLSMPLNEPLSFSAGIPTAIQISTQGVANVLVNNIFETALAVNIVDGDGTTVTSNTDTIALTVYKDSGCSTTATGSLGGAISKAATSGSASFTNLTYDTAEDISIKVESGTLTSACMNVTTVHAVPASIYLEDLGAGTTGVNLTGTIKLKDANDNLITNKTGSAISITIASDNDSNIDAISNTVSIADGASSVTYELAALENGSANITASSTTPVLTSNSQPVTFTAGTVTQVAHISSPYAAVEEGEITIELEALSAQGIRNTSYSGTFLVTHSGGVSITAPTFVILSNGYGTFNVESSIAQSISLNVTEFTSTGLSMPTNENLTFTTGVPAAIQIDTQAIANVLENAVFETSLIVSIVDSGGTTITTSTDTISLSVFKDAGCSTVASGTLGGTLSKAATLGQATFSNLVYDAAENISIQVSSGSLTSACTNMTSVFPTPSLSASPGTVVNVGDSVTIKLIGGIPTIGNYALTVNNSDATLGTQYACGDDVCILYTAGLQGGGASDTVSITDSKSNTETISITVNGAKLALNSGDSNYSGVELLIDNTETFTIENSGNALTGAISASFTPTDSYAEDESLMWVTNAVNCVGANLANGQTCTIDLSFLAGSGPGVERTYQGTLLIQGATGGVLSQSVTAILGPKVNANPATYDFGSVATTATHQFSFTNIVDSSDTGALTISLVGGSPCLNFSIQSQNNCSNITTGTCTVDIEADTSGLGTGVTKNCTLSVNGATSLEKLVPMSVTKP